jgi:hypothetical protein
MTDKTAIEAARLRVQEAKEKVERQQKRYAMAAIEGEAPAKSEKAQAAKALMLELEAELEASQEALRKLETGKPGA